MVIVLLGVIGFMAFGSKKDTVVEDDRGTPVAPILDEVPQSSGHIFDGEEEKAITESNQYLKVDAKYPAFENKDISEIVEDFVQTQLAQFKSETNIDDMSQSEKDFLFQNGSKYEFSTTYKIYETENLSTVLFSISTYTGGAHNSLVLRSLNFNDQGKTITIGDLFQPESNYLSELSTLSRTKLKASLKDNSAEWFTDGTTPITSNFETFYLTDENILHIVFQPYQVAAWVAGAPEITIDIKTELKDVISSDFVNE